MIYGTSMHAVMSAASHVHMCRVDVQRNQTPRRAGPELDTLKEPVERLAGLSIAGSTPYANIGFIDVERSNAHDNHDDHAYIGRTQLEGDSIDCKRPVLHETTADGRP